MGWRIKWLSSFANHFNRDYHVIFTPEERETGRAYYNYTTASFPAPEGPGLSVFYRDDGGAVYHTYSAYSRGIDIINGAYQVLDLVPKGRDEAGLSYSMEWLERHDAYAPAPLTIGKGPARR